jgi:hypothetical protein
LAGTIVDNETIYQQDLMKKLLFTCLLIPIISFSQTKLSTAKQKLSSNSSSSSTSSSSGSSSSSSSSDRTFGNLFADIFVEVFLIAGYEGLFGHLEYRHFAPYPYYYDNVNGEYDFGAVDGDKRSLLKARVNYFSANSIQGVQANVTYRFLPVLGLELSHNNFFENNLVGNSDNLNTTSFLLNYYRIRERSVTGWWGIGATYVGNEVNTAGFVYAIGLEVYPCKPISLQASFQQSFINESNINELRFQLKYHRKKVAYYTGYHDYSIAGIGISGFVLGVEVGF